MGAILFLLVGLASFVMAYLLEGGQLGALFALTAALFVFGGTIGAVGFSFPLHDLKRFPMVVWAAFSEHRSSPAQAIAQFVEITGIARREGVLALDRYMDTHEQIDGFTKTGLRLIVDGSEPEAAAEVMNSYLESMSERHRSGIGMMETAGRFAPFLGILGTVLALMRVLGDPIVAVRLAPSLGLTLIATVYGLASAYLIWLPLATKLKGLDALEMRARLMAIEGVTLVGHGANPRFVAQKLQSYLDPAELRRFVRTFQVEAAPPHEPKPPPPPEEEEGPRHPPSRRGLPRRREE